MAILNVAFFREIIGFIDTDGPKGNWLSSDTPLARFLEGNHAGQLPNTFKNLQPEGWLAGVLSGKNYVEDGIRFLSNLTIVKDGSPALDKIGIDTLHAHLQDCTDENGCFTGKYVGPASASFNPAFETTVANLWHNELMPKFSGAQVKIPVSLMPDENGSHIMMPAVRTTFSHILKVPREGFYASFPAIEWAGLEMARRAGLPTAHHALVEMPDGMAPALAIERFDIPEFGDDLRYLTRISDFCNIAEISPDKKYSTDISLCFAALERQSSAPEEDKIALFKRLVLSQCMMDGDMHLKNISVLKTFDRETGNVDVRFTPVYDAMTTAIYPDLDNRESALNYDPQPEYEGAYSKSINSRTDLMEVAKANGISWEQADEIIDHISQSVIDTAIDIVRNPPEILKDHPACMLALRCMATEIYYNSSAPNLPEFSDDEMAWPNEYSEPEKPETSPVTLRAAPVFNGPSF